MKDWLMPTLGAILCWGGWAFLPKLSAQYISDRSAIVYQGLGGAILASLIFLNRSDAFETQPQGAIIAILAGMLNWGCCRDLPKNVGWVALALRSWGASAVSQCGEPVR